MSDTNLYANQRFAEFSEQDPKIYLQGLFEQSSTKKHPLGTRRRISDGREFIYVRNSATNLAAGFTVMGPVTDPTNYANLAIAANVAANAHRVQLTLGNTTAANTANAFAEGYLYVNSGSGVIGDMYKIRSHAAIAANANGWFNLYDKVRTAMTTSHKASIVLNPYNNVLLANGAAGALGVSVIDLTANYYGWIQTRGPCCVMTAGTLVVGDPAYHSEAAGEAMPSSGNAIDMAVINKLGTVLQVNANDHASIIDLSIS